MLARLLFDGKKSDMTAGEHRCFHKEVGHMILRAVDRNDPEELSRIQAVYETSFPREERAPFSLLCKRVRQRRAEMYSFWHENQWCGMVYMVTYQDLAYVFYFVIDTAQRGHGLGTQAIAALLDKYRNGRLFLALEDWREPCDNLEQRLKRHRFYQNCGLEDLPYYIKEASVVYAIMGKGGKIEPEEYRALMNRYMGFWMRHFIDMRMIKER